MKISFNWLKEYLDITLPAEQVAEMLTNCGLEVEGMEKFQSLKGGLAGCVVGEVKTCVKHPNADKLSLTTVDVGTGTLLNIVCGAPNVAAGQKVVVALVGSMMYPATGESFEIKKSKIRGENSEGMICAEDEIGLGTSHAGVIVLPSETKVGMTAKEFFKVEEDVVFEIGLTPNRADAASHIGVARDVLAVLKSQDSNIKYQISIPSLDKFKIDNDNLHIVVEVADTNACPRYSGITVTGVEVKESPQWLKNKLNAIGVGPINNIVDITNYVLHECGQPLHAFDADQITGKKVVVRKAAEGEKFVTLDGVERTLTANDLMICNTADAMCIAGVFGGIKSGIGEGTKNVFIESAYFNPATVRKTSKHHGLKTDASFRFERGTDPEATIYALKRTAMLIKEIAGGTISSEVIDVYPSKIEPKKIAYNVKNANDFIGKNIEKEKIKNILTSLNIGIESENDNDLLLTVPTYKVDVTREADVVEEVLRIYGLNNVEVPDKLSASLSYFPKTDPEKIQSAVSDYLSSDGFFEIMTNSLTKQKYSEVSEAWDPAKDVKILNPLSQDHNVMRQSLIYSGLEAIEYNRNRKNADLKLYEFGTTYRLSSRGYDEQFHLALFITGKKFEASWNADKLDVNFFLLKTYVENVLKKAGLHAEHLKEDSVEDAVFHYAVSLLHHDKEVVRFGAIRKSHLKQFDISDEVFYADFNWGFALKVASANKIEYREVAKFPQVRRDLSMMIATDVSYSKIREIAFKMERNLLKEMYLFDVYEGEKIEKGKKSYAISFIIQDERQTLTDKQIDKIMSRLMEALERDAGAVIRKR